MKTSFLSGVSIAALALAGAVAVNAEDAAAPTSNATAATVVESMTSAQAGLGNYATMQAASDWRSSKVVGLNVYNGKAEKIGDINDLIIGTNGAVTHAIVGVGGFLGLGEKNVAIPFTSVKMSRDKDGKISAMVDSTKDALTAAPAFKFYAANS